MAEGYRVEAGHVTIRHLNTAVKDARETALRDVNAIVNYAQVRKINPLVLKASSRNRPLDR